MQQLSLGATDLVGRAVSPFLELGAYEALWDRDNASFKTIAETFAKAPDALPSDFVDAKQAASYANDVHLRLKEAGVDHYGDAFTELLNIRAVFVTPNIRSNCSISRAGGNL